MRAAQPSRRRAPHLLILAAALALGVACEESRARPLRLVLSLHGALSRPVHGIDVTVALPEGARVAHDAATRRLSRGSLSPRDGARDAELDATFLPHATTPSLRILLASKVPMRDGEVAAVDLVVVSVAPPARARFEVAKVAIGGPGGAPVPGATAWVSAVDPR